MALRLEDNTIAHFHLNWLSPVKLRRTLIGGSRKMVVYDHQDADNQVKIFDKGVDLLDNDEERYKVLVQYRTGDLLVPKIDQTEPLETACRHFLNCIQTGTKPISIKALKAMFVISVLVSIGWIGLTSSPESEPSCTL